MPRAMSLGCFCICEELEGRWHTRAQSYPEHVHIKPQVGDDWLCPIKPALTPEEEDAFLLAMKPAPMKKSPFPLMLSARVRSSLPRGAVDSEETEQQSRGLW